MFWYQTLHTVTSLTVSAPSSRVMVLKITASWGSQGRTFPAFIRPELSWAGTMGCLRTGT